MAQEGLVKFMDREKVINGLDEITHYDGEQMFYNDIFIRGIADDALALLKEQEAVVKQWTKEIADNQLAHAPDELDRENWDYKKGIWDGLQIAWNIISEGR